MNADNFSLYVPEETEDALLRVVDAESNAHNHKRLDEDFPEKGKTIEEDGNFSQTIDLDSKPVRNDSMSVPEKAVKFAMKQCHRFLSEIEHDDVDAFTKVCLTKL